MDTVQPDASHDLPQSPQKALYVATVVFNVSPSLTTSIVLCVLNVLPVIMYSVYPQSDFCEKPKLEAEEWKDFADSTIHRQHPFLC